jgi:glyoxylase-like metal-dependent hydrolase (beta-lactamase superfamily II)
MSLDSEISVQKHTLPTPFVVGDVHLYTADLEGELVLFDTGPDTPEALDFLQRHVDLARLRHVFVTHCHVEHYGLAKYLAENTQAEIYFPRLDDVKIRHHESRIDHIHELLLGYGFSDGFIRTVRESVDRRGLFPPVPDRYRVVEESETPAQLGISWMSCPGHSQSDLVYRVGDWAVTGDTLLENIFQAPLLDVNLETFSGRFRNYDAYCDSLFKLGQLRGCRVLPGHREESARFEETVHFYVAKLIERAGRIKAFEEVEAVSEVIDRLFGDTLSDPFVVYIKASEVIFMRDFLADPGRLQGALEEIGLLPRVREALEAVAA